MENLRKRSFAAQLSGLFVLCSVLLLGFASTVNADTIYMLTQPLGFAVQTDSQGNIIQWGIELFSTVDILATFNVVGAPGVEITDFTNVGPGAGTAGVDNNPGTWSSSTTVPEPPSMLLLVVGLLGATSGLRRRPLGKRRDL